MLRADGKLYYPNRKGQSQEGVYPEEERPQSNKGTSVWAQGLTTRWVPLILVQPKKELSNGQKCVKMEKAASCS